MMKYVHYQALPEKRAYHHRMELRCAESDPVCMAHASS